MPLKKSVLVTGGAGFIGSHLVDELLKENEVTVLDNFSSGHRDNLGTALDHPRFHLVEGDLLERETVDEALRGQDIVFHLAANPDVRMGASDTSVHLEQNLMGTHMLLEAMRFRGVRRLAFTSTSTVYGEASKVPTPEDYAPLKPISLYGASKLACEAFICSYCYTFDLQSWIFRFANIVGPRGGHGVLVDFIKKLRTDPSTLEILGSGRQRKSYLGVEDCVSAMVHCVDNSGDRVNIFNIGSRDLIDVTSIADLVTEKMGLQGVQYRYTGGSDGGGWKGDVKIMLLSIEALERTGWQPRYGSREAISRAVEALLLKE